MTRGEKALVTFLSWVVMAPFGGCASLQDALDRLDYSKHSPTSHYAEEQRARVASGEISAEEARPKMGWTGPYTYIGREERSVGVSMSASSGHGQGSSLWDRHHRARSGNNW